MRKTITVTAVVLFSIVGARIADGQPALEELEKRIRRETAGQPAPGRPQPRDVSERGYLGAVVDDRQDEGPGVRILEVLPGGPADRAGLRAGDLVNGLGDVKVRRMSDMSAVLEAVPVGGEVAFQILRGDKPQKIKVTLGRRPPPEERKFKQLATPETNPPGQAVRAPIVEPPAQAQKSPMPVGDDPTRIEILERRIRELEERIERLERILAERR